MLEQDTFFKKKQLAITVLLVSSFLLSSPNTTLAQTPKTYPAAELLQQCKKLNVLGSVLYIAAHPDDENTRLLAYLANEKLYRTGYLSLTRGDGGQNLIGDEQGIDLGLIRTQELLSARRMDGAEQFFSRAFDFGFCKTPEEALSTWGHDKILSDVVWVIRQFKPDVIITRFPEDSRAGHGHHAASAILAREAFDAAADPTRFAEQLSKDVTVWQAKRLLWNTYNFGSTNTTSEEQFKQEVGMFNPLLGTSYGEIAAQGRSQHKSQGFGVPAQRGTATEYFTTTKGTNPKTDLMDGIDFSWNRVEGNKQKISSFISQSIIRDYDMEHPEKLVAPLVKLYQQLSTIKDEYWRAQKQKAIKLLLENCSGLFMEAAAANHYAAVGDSLKITATINNRLNLRLPAATVTIFDSLHRFDTLKANVNNIFNVTSFIQPNQKTTQPYWLVEKMEKGSFNVSDQQLIGNAESAPLAVNFTVNLQGVDFTFKKPLRYKFTDPVKGEIYQPVQWIDPVGIKAEPSLLLFRNNDTAAQKEIHFSIQANKAINDRIQLSCVNGNTTTVFDSTVHFAKGEKRTFGFGLNSRGLSNNSKAFYGGKITSAAFVQDQMYALHQINYDHIPEITYHAYDQVQVLKLDLKTAGSLVGYIAGAGDKVPQALEQMGYKVVLLKQSDLTAANLRQFDAVITGVRAYNIHEWLSNSFDALMQYVNEGGVLLTQYNTNNAIGPVKAKISPLPFTISRNRITDETAAVNFLLPNHPALNYPNKITPKDFEGWVQERSIYNAENIDAGYQRILSMKDPGEKEQDGSLIIANYGKGRFVYTGLVFFRELPAGVPGAFRLLANLIATTRL